MAASEHLPALWSAEEPNLYVLVLSVVTTDGEHLDSESVQVIFGRLTSTSEAPPSQRHVVGNKFSPELSEVRYRRWASGTL